MSTNEPSIITVSAENLLQEHICCALAESKTDTGVALKKEWLRERFTEGLVFKKINVRGKAFIEYIPAEYAWAPVEAPGYMFINCFWVSGRLKGQGLGSRLLEECLAGSTEANGVVVVTSKPKRPWLTDRTFFLKKGFEIADTAPPYFELLVRRFQEAPMPRFRENAKRLTVDASEGLFLHYTNQCPYTETYVQELREAANRAGIPLKTRRITSREEAQSVPSPHATYSLFYNGRFVTHEIMPADKLSKVIGRDL